MYEFPIKVLMKQLHTELGNEVYKAIQEVGIFVDKEELVRALKYDRDQYEKGYCDGLKEGAERTTDLVEVVRCEKCEDFESHGNGKAGICRNKEHKPCLRYAEDFCSYGKRKEEV